jgi:hypothetical protein
MNLRPLDDEDEGGLLLDVDGLYLATVELKRLFLSSPARRGQVFGVVATGSPGTTGTAGDDRSSGFDRCGDRGGESGIDAYDEASLPGRAWAASHEVLELVVGRLEADYPGLVAWKSTDRADRSGNDNGVGVSGGGDGADGAHVDDATIGDGGSSKRGGRIVNVVAGRHWPAPARGVRPAQPAEAGSLSSSPPSSSPPSSSPPSSFSSSPPSSSPLSPSDTPHPLEQAALLVQEDLVIMLPVTRRSQATVTATAAPEAGDDAAEATAGAAAASAAAEEGPGGQSPRSPPAQPASSSSETTAAGALEVEYVLGAACVCFADRWRLEDKVGQACCLWVLAWFWCWLYTAVGFDL